MQAKMAIKMPLSSYAMEKGEVPTGSYVDAYGTHYYQESYVGCVLATREENYYDDSDYYAVVWDEEHQRITRIDYDTTRFAGGGSASIDATDEVKEKAAKYIHGWLQDVIFDELVIKAKVIEKGKRVKVTSWSSNKVPTGTEGVVFWKGTVNYGRTKWSEQTRIGFTTDEGETCWVPAGYCEVIDWLDWMPVDVQTFLKEFADKNCHGGWHRPLTYNSNLIVI
jgi:hypothetical protein